MNGLVEFILLCQVTLLLYKTIHTLGIVDILLIYHIYAHPLKFHTVKLYVIRAPNPAGNLVHFFSFSSTHKINENGV